jgi:hypothetical protein
MPITGHRPSLANPLNREKAIHGLQTALPEHSAPTEILCYPISDFRYGNVE